MLRHVLITLQGMEMVNGIKFGVGVVAY